MTDDAKIMGQFRLELGGIMQVFNLYGMGVYSTEAMKAIENLATQMHRRLNGEDIPYDTGWRY